MIIYFASDHAGFTLKNKLKEFVTKLGYEAVDCGPNTLDESDDYPDIIPRAVVELRNNTEARAIILGGSGQGEAMVANRFVGVRAVVYYGGNTDILTLSREHNDANTLSLGARFLNEAEAQEAVKIWLETQFSGDERHARRINKIDTHG